MVEEPQATDYEDMEALWHFCRGLVAESGGRRCCPPNADCAAQIHSVARIDPETTDAINGTHAGVSLPYIGGAAKLLPFIFQERYEGSRFIFSPASHWEPREEPVQAACNAWLARLQMLIRIRRLGLLMRWDPLGYFDVFWQFDSNREYGPSLKSSVLSVLLGRQVTDKHMAEDIWHEWISVGGADQLHNGGAGAGVRNETASRQAALEWWSDTLDDVISAAYESLRDLEADITVLQHTEMSRGVTARKQEVKWRRATLGSVVVLGGVAISVATGLIAAPVAGGAIAALGWSHISGGSMAGLATVAGLAWAGAGRVGITAAKEKLADQKKTSADRFGQAHKTLSWLRFQREWIERFMEVDIRQAFDVARPMLNLREAVKTRLICDYVSDKEGSETDLAENDKEDDDGIEEDCNFRGVDAEVQLKGAIFASWVNLVMVDGGCRTSSDFEPFVGPAVAAFGNPKVHAACCAREDTCFVQSLRQPNSTGKSICPEGWTRVAPDWSFRETEYSWEADWQAENNNLQQTCCGDFASAPHGSFKCGIKSCANNHAAAPELQLQPAVEDIGWRLNCRGDTWKTETLLRDSYCMGREKKDVRFCKEARAFALCKPRRAFCLAYASRKHQKSKKRVQRLIRQCLLELKDMAAGQNT
eukprot:gnl/TRDRNA2_/TRDRNA2_92437_c0_seq1.p1 gnl/TRDRNA2_/TRDRNA2_92437_c0~~gnl/TRDRNA2_/TRDRNA2_92437_c0_seq1.p1  ORF type:complete len:701 (-),score=103.47 gnl/TRDRNA2_/TRDRNA2_92437_c0_seq1:43-1983(-)